MKRLNIILVTLTVAFAPALLLPGADLVNDTWLDGTRSDPGAYSEYGVDADLDGNIESAWFQGGTGTLDPVGLGGPLRGDLTAGGTGSGSWTTYFTPNANSVTLANVGDMLKVTWAFKLGNVGIQNSSQNFRVALVETPDADRIQTSGAPPDSTFTGYGMLMNMGVTLGRTTPFRIVERSLLTTGNLLSSSGNWATFADDTAVVGDTGYAADTLYTFVMSLTRTAAGLDIAASITGGSLGNDGVLQTSGSDASPNTYTFDTFAIRPSSATGTAQIFDTSLFQVELTQVPEPSMLALLGLGGLGLFLRRRK